MELLRIISIFMVLLLHSSCLNFYQVNIDSFKFKVYNFYDSIVRSAAPLFFMISGAFLLKKSSKIDFEKLFKKNIFKLIVVFFFWSFIYALVNHFFLDEPIKGIKDLIEKIFVGPFHFWFIPSLILIYILTPFLSRIIDKKDFNLEKYFIFLFLFNSIIYTLNCIAYLPHCSLLYSIFTHFNTSILCNHIAFFLLGYFLYNTDILDKYNRLIYVLGLISPIICICATYWFSYMTNYAQTSLYDNFSIFTIMECISIFIFFKNHKFNFSNRINNIILKISQNTLGIYVIHIIVLNLLNKYTIFGIENYNVLISIPVLAIMTFVISLIFTYVLRKVKIVNKYLL